MKVFAHGILSLMQNFYCSRFRRQKGEACLPGEQKADSKKSRREKRKKLQQKQHLEDLKKMIEQKIKKEKKEKDDDEEEKYEPKVKSLSAY